MKNFIFTSVILTFLFLQCRSQGTVNSTNNVVPAQRTINKAPNGKEYFKDDDGFFFFIGIDVPKTTVNLVWDEIIGKPLQKYVLERSTDGKIFTPVIVQSTQNKPGDIRKMSEIERRNVQTLNAIVYTTETGNGRFIFNEKIPRKLIDDNFALKQIADNKVNWNNKELLESAYNNIPLEQTLTYRIKFFYSDGSIQYSGQRSLSDYLSFILKRALLKENPENTINNVKDRAPIWQSTNNNNDSLQLLGLCPAVNGPPDCAVTQGNANAFNGTCCTYKKQDYLTEQLGGTPCSSSGSGGYCSPLVLDCGSSPYSSDPCCVGSGCEHYADCGCKPWECCTYSQAAVSYVIQSTDNNLAVNATSTSSPCGNSATATITGGQSPYTISWSPGGYSTATITNVPGGNYTVTVTDATGCTKTDNVAVVGSNAPVAIFNSTNVCLGQTTSFTDQSTVTNATITSWSWDFGDGGASTLQNPDYVYPASGNFAVTLVVSASNGCSSTITHTVAVYPQPLALFTATTVCVGNATNFTDQSTGGGTIWNWQFGDGGSSTTQSPAHIYATSGTYTATLTVSATGGCNSISTKVITVNPTLISNFSFNTVCLKNTTQFTDLSTGASSWIWTFGNGATSNLQNPAIIYSAPNTYTVSLIAATTDGCKDTTDIPITVNPLPVANFGSADVCLHQGMHFNDSSTVTSGSVVGWLWNFGDNPVAILQNPIYIYSNSGTYSVSLICTTNFGCKDTITKSVIVHPLPVAQFYTIPAPIGICDGTTINFNDASTISAPDNLQSWAWNLGDASPIKFNQNVSYLYAAANSYNVQLTVASNFGCLDSITKPITINPNPVVNFVADDTVGCEPLCINFQDLSTISTGTNVQWDWNLGDGSPLNTAQNPPNCYNNDSVFSPNHFSISLTVTSDSGCVSSLSKNNYITVYPNPVADFNINPTSATIIDPVISIVNLSIGANFWNWDFGGSTPLTTGSTSTNNDTSNLEKPWSHTYADTGTYLISLIVTTQYGCTDNEYHTIIIEPDFVFYVPNTFSPNGDNINDTFTGKGIFIIEFEMLIYDRWGNKIFKTTDYDVPWDGKANEGAEMAQQDVYVYLINLTDIFEKKHHYRGHVNLVK